MVQRFRDRSSLIKGTLDLSWQCAESENMRHALIVGGGIGGLFSAICLRLTGWNVQVLEQAPALQDIGAGIQVSPNGTRLLQATGVYPHIERTSVSPEAIELRNGLSGRVFCTVPLGEYAVRRWGAPYIHIHRADFITALKTRLFELQPDALVLQAQLTDFTQNARTVSATVADGRVFEADILIGADGVHSFVRQQMFGQDKPSFTGNVAYRAVVHREKLGDMSVPMTASVWTGAAKHAVTTNVRGGDLVNFVGVVEQDAVGHESWSQNIDRTIAQYAFRDFHPLVRLILAKADHVGCWPLLTREPLRHWSEGRVILLGDSAHPMLPSMAQGGVQSLEDGYVLAHSLRNSENIEQSAYIYFQTRINRVSRIQAQSAANLRLYHHRSRLSQLMRYVPLEIASRTTPSLIYRQLDWVMKQTYPPLF